MIHFIHIILPIFFFFQLCSTFMILTPTKKSFTQLQGSSKRSGAMSRKKKDRSSNNADFGKYQNIDDDSIHNSIITTTTDNDKRQRKSGIIYSRPALYDLAFGYRNYEEEVQFLLDAHNKYSSMSKSINHEQLEKRNILEIAAGPARHSITSLRNHPNLISSCTALDLSNEMMIYSNEIADDELGDSGMGGIRDRFHYVLADMRYFGGEDDYNNDGDNSIQRNSMDSVWILLGSMQHLTTNDDVISCFNSASHTLRSGGTMIIELPHPRETFTMVECTRNSWEVPLEDETGTEYGELKVIWGDDDDVFDPIRQVRDFTVAMELTINDKSMETDASDLQSVKEVVPMRLFTYQEINALGRLCGLEVVGLYGALSDEVDVNNEDEAFRLVCVLKKIH